MVDLFHDEVDQVILSLVRYLNVTFTTIVVLLWGVTLRQLGSSLVPGGCSVNTGPGRFGDGCRGLVTFHPGLPLLPRVLTLAMGSRCAHIGLAGSSP